ncbi:MAG: hypothetical protein SGILL_003320 [Bacillariaceae sp.]
MSSSSFQETFDTPQQQRVKVVAGFALQQRLGSGSFATVYKGIRIPTSNVNSNKEQETTEGEASTSQSSEPDTVAIKAIARTSEKLTKKVLQNLEIEISILRTYRHPNIVCMHNVQKTDRHFYLILEYCGGGDVQRLIRTRKNGRLSERLTRRLMRDLSAGLKFLWGQELIHRDIKPQNLLLTGALPLDEVNDPDATPEEEAKRKQMNFPSAQYSLKIADFGFARHLQTASLAETLCGSPLYMAPEILQHHRYDAKADLWSVGTVLFEMIAGRPPFNGENHIDLLRNIQRKAVRLPPDVRVSKACVNLLRLLLNRNPLSRAGFKEFFEACDTFVALGCEGMGSTDAGTCRMPKSNDLGTIPENDGGSNSPSASSDSLMTVATTSRQEQQQQQQQQQQPATYLQGNPGVPPSMQEAPSAGAPIVSPQLSAAPTPASAAMIPNANLYETRPYQPASQRNRLQPLTNSPPSSGPYANPHSSIPVQVPSLTLGMPQVSSVGQNWNQNHQQQQQQQQTSTGVSQSQASAGDDSEFVMVEHSLGSSRNEVNDTSSAVTTSRRNPQQYYVNAPPPNLSARNDLGIPLEERVKITKGMLSTSPGTGKMLLGMVSRAAIGLGGVSNVAQENAKLGDEIAAAAKMIATAEDVGRRAVSVAHLGDTRAYLGMRLIFKSNEEGSSILSSTPMEGVEEDVAGNDDRPGSSGVVASTEIMMPLRRRSSTTSDKHMAEAIAEEDEDATEEMPFAISPEAPSVTLPSRSNASVYNRSTAMSSMKKSSVKADPQTVQGHFGEALSCYLKALQMLKGALGAAQRVSSDLESLQTQVGRSPTNYDVPKMKKRCEVTTTWLCTQFRGVLERGDAANVELAKLAKPTSEEAKEEQTPTVTSVEELIYNHALASGRDGAVKHLLGQYDAARSCYRSAGLLAETLLMEAQIGADDRKILESYVDGFAARITELDQLMLQQSKMTGSSSRRGSGVVGLIGPPPSAPTAFLVGTPSSR